MRVVAPSHQEIVGLQERERAFYFSAAFGGILRKHGVAAPADGVDGVVFICRGTRWPDDAGNRPLVLEGPLSPSAAGALAITTRRRRAELLELRDSEGAGLGVLCYNRATVRRIPAESTIRSDPYPFVAADARWNATAFEYDVLEPEPGDTPVLLVRREDGRTDVVGLRRGPHLVLGVPALDVVVQHQTAPPYGGVGYYAMTAYSDLHGLEEWLIASAAGLACEVGLPVVRLGAWPDGRRAALTIRHDYDRRIGDRTLRSLLRFYRRRGVKSTWFWRVSTADDTQIERVRASGHEVALHTEAASGAAFGDELRFFGVRGSRIAGYAAHGGPPSPGYLGLEQIEWALAHGLRYGEMLGGGNRLPLPAIVLRDCVPAVSDLVLPGQHRGLDLGMGPEAHAYDELLPAAAAALRDGEHVVLMNHADLHQRELKRLVRALDLRDVWTATMVEVVDWFGATRTASYRTAGPGRVRLTFGRPLTHALAVDLALPRRPVHTLVPAGAQEVDLAGAVEAVA